VFIYNYVIMYSVFLFQIAVDYMQLSGLRFSSDMYHASIPENATGKRELVMMQVIGQALNEHLTFSILNPRDLFTVRPTSGVVCMSTEGRLFDREARENYMLVVEVINNNSNNNNNNEYIFEHFDNIEIIQSLYACPLHIILFQFSLLFYTLLFFAL